MVADFHQNQAHKRLTRGDSSVAAALCQKSLRGALWRLALDIAAWAFVRGTSAWV